MLRKGSRAAGGRRAFAAEQKKAAGKEAMKRVAKEKKLTEKQKRFYDYCAKGILPTDAASLAGYRNAAREAKRLMQKAEPAYTKEKTEENPVAQKAEILGFLTEMMREDEDPRMRMKAAELLGKQAKLFEKEEKPEQERHIIIVDDIS